MSVIVSFVSVKGAGSVHAPAVSDVRVRETLALGGTDTSAMTEEGELVFVLNNETSAVLVAFGSNPDASLAAKSSVSSAGVPVPAGGVIALYPPENSKINAQAIA